MRQCESCRARSWSQPPSIGTYHVENSRCLLFAHRHDPSRRRNGCPCDRWDPRVIAEARDRGGLSQLHALRQRSSLQATGRHRTCAKNPAEFDLVVLGSPVWAGHVPHPCCNMYDTTAKILRPSRFLRRNSVRVPTKCSGNLAMRSATNPSPHSRCYSVTSRPIVLTATSRVLSTNLASQIQPPDKAVM